MEGWRRVIGAADCTYADWDTEHEYPTCPVCKVDYAECDCPGPTMMGYEYKEEDGVLWARKDY